MEREWSAMTTHHHWNWTFRWVFLEAETTSSMTTDPRTTSLHGGRLIDEMRVVRAGQTMEWWDGATRNHLERNRTLWVLKDEKYSCVFRTPISALATNPMTMRTVDVVIERKAFGDMISSKSWRKTRQSRKVSVIELLWIYSWCFRIHLLQCEVSLGFVQMNWRCEKSLPKNSLAQFLRL
jgi:hypothetical protein